MKAGELMAARETIFLPAATVFLTPTLLGFMACEVSEEVDAAPAPLDFCLSSSLLLALVFVDSIGLWGTVKLVPVLGFVPVLRARLFRRLLLRHIVVVGMLGAVARKRRSLWSHRRARPRGARQRQLPRHPRAESTSGEHQ